MATISATLAAGSVASPFYYQVNISETLCKNSCGNATPDFNPTFVLLGYTSVGANQYVANISVRGTISYIPCGGSVCCTKSQLVYGVFSVPFYSETAPTSVTISQGACVSDVSVSGCNRCGNTFVCETPLTLTLDEAAVTNG